MQRIVTITLLAISLCLSIAFTSAQAANGKDHPLINRFPGANIAHYEHLEYEEMSFILSKPYKKDGTWVADKTQPVAGKVTYIHYELPKTKSPLQVFRNYQKAIKKQNMTVLFNCERTCVNVNAGHLDHLYNNHQDFYFNYGFDQYIVAKRDNFYLSLIVNDGGVFQLVIEEETLNDDLISPIAEALASTGKIDLYGFHFDSGKSALKPESDSELAELATILNEHPALRIKIVGHTDNVGDSKANQKLSAARAKSVLNALVKNFNVNAANLSAEGQGETQPVDTNSTEMGRAKNRRVEIIAINPEVINGGTANTYNTDHTTAEAAAEAQQEAPADNSGNIVDSAEEVVDKAEKVKDVAKRFKKFF